MALKYLWAVKEICNLFDERVRRKIAEVIEHATDPWRSWTDVMIFKIFSPKKSAFLTQNKATLCKNLIITLVFEKNAKFFNEKWQKSQKIVIITSTHGDLVPGTCNDRDSRIKPLLPEFSISKKIICCFALQDTFFLPLLGWGEE
jgi:hypothetical protein